MGLPKYPQREVLLMVEALHDPIYQKPILAMAAGYIWHQPGSLSSTASSSHYYADTGLLHPLPTYWVLGQCLQTHWVQGPKTRSDCFRKTTMTCLHLEAQSPYYLFKLGVLLKGLKAPLRGLGVERRQV